MTTNELELPEEHGAVTLPNGSTLYWKLDSTVGCREWYSDEIGGGVHVWNTALVDQHTLLAAIVEEERLRRLEYEFVRRKCRNGCKTDSEAVVSGGVSSN